MTQKTDETLYLVDGSGFIFRAFYALPPMNRADGTPVNAVYGFCSMMHKLLADLKAQRIAVIFDAARKTFRTDLYPAYKANRPPPPEDLVPQFALIRRATEAFGVLALEREGYEADDLIAAYARLALEKGISVRIVSADKDLMQLIRPGVELFDPMKNTVVTLEAVEKKFGVLPEKVVDVQALAGDSTDNVPGVPGIGVKTAAQLIDAYGSLEVLLERASEIKQNARREKLMENADLALLSKKLVTLDAQAPVPEPLEALLAPLQGEGRLIAFLQEQGFKSLATRLGGGGQLEKAAAVPSPSLLSSAPLAASETATDDPQGVYELIQDKDALRRFLDLARQEGLLAIDTETDSLTPSTTQLVGVCLAAGKNRACYIPLAHKDPEGAAQEGGFAFTEAKAPKQIALDVFIEEMHEILRDPSVLKIAHNLKFDAQVLAQHGLEVTPYDDTMLISYVLEAGLHGHGLDELALRFLGHKMIAFEEVAGSGKNRITFDYVPLEAACAYAAEDADYTLRLWRKLKPRLQAEGLLTVYETLERPLVPVIARMETDGILIDAALLRVQSGQLAARMQKQEEAVQLLAGRSFNLASPKQLGEVLFSEMGLPGGVKGKNGAFSTSADVLEPLAEAGYEIVEKLLDYRALAKLKSTYTDALPAQISARTRRVHTSYSMVGAATGRLSSTEPNLQNIPIRTEEGRAIRRAFIAPEGSVLLSVDYSQIELRLAASAAKVSALIEAFYDGADIHALTASQVFGVPMAEMTPEIRRRAKAINFGIIYGISGFGLAKQLGITPSEATTFIRAYLSRFHELRDWMEETKAFARAHGYVETLLGRRIHVPSITDKNAARRAGAERQAINAPLQGTAADIIKRAMIRLPQALREEGLEARLLLQVHDELVLEVPQAQIEATAALVARVMEQAPLPVLSLAVPLTAAASWAQNWAQAH